MKNINIKLPSIHCESCVKLIKMSLNWVEWIVDFSINLDNRLANISFDENKINTNKIVSLIKDDAWYDAILESK